MPASAALIDLERLEYICTSCLHLLKIYINEIYPKGCKYISVLFLDFVSVFGIKC